MKTYKLKIPLSLISIKEQEEKYFDWKWIFFEDIVSSFIEEIRRNLDLSYNDYQEKRESDEYYSFRFHKNSIEYFGFFIWHYDTKEFVEFEMNFDAFEVKNYLLFKRKIRSEQHYKKPKEIILKFIKINYFEISDVEK